MFLSLDTQIKFLHTLVGYELSSRRGDRNTYYDGLTKIIEKIKGIEELELILHIISNARLINS